MKVYNAQKPLHRAAFGREIGQCKEIMRRIVLLTQQFKQDAVSKELMTRMQAIVPAEELQDQQQQPALQ